MQYFYSIKTLPISYGFPLFSFLTFEINLLTSHAPQSSGQVIVFSGVAHFNRFLTLYRVEDSIRYQKYLTVYRKMVVFKP